MQNLEDQECNEGGVVPSGKDGQEERRKASESKAAAVHRLEAKAPCQIPAENLRSELIS